MQSGLAQKQGGEPGRLLIACIGVVHDTGHGGVVTGCLGEGARVGKGGLCTLPLRTWGGKGRVCSVLPGSPSDSLCIFGTILNA